MELFRKCKTITLEEENKSSHRDIMKGKGRKLVNGCLFGRVLHPREVSKEGLKAALQ